MSVDVTMRIREATTTASALMAHSAELTTYSAALGSEIERKRLELAALRLMLHDARRALTATLAHRTTIEVAGTIDGVDVVATWIDGRLEGSTELVRRAEMLVAMGEHLTTADTDATDEPDHTVAERRFTASLAGPPLAVALTLMRACTRVRSVEFPVAS